MHAEHQAHSRVLPADVCLALPQLDVGVSKLQDAGAVDAAQRGGRVTEQKSSPTNPPKVVNRLPPPDSHSGELHIPRVSDNQNAMPRGWIF